MPDLNDLNRPLTSDTEPNVLDTLRAHIVRAATWAGWSSTANKVAGLMSGVTAAVSGGRSLRLYRRNDANTADEEVVSLPGISVGGNAGTASAAQAGSTLRADLDARAQLNSPAFTGTPTVPTAVAGTNTTQAASTAFVRTAVASVVNTAPAALDTLHELAAALGNDANFAASVNAALANRVVRESSTRPGVTRLYRADADSDFSVQVTFDGSRWLLRGYSGSNFNGECRVGYADSAGAALTVATSVALNATAAATAGAVGTYVFASGAFNSPNVQFGGTAAGSSLQPSSAIKFLINPQVIGFSGGGWLTGTWRCMGFYQHAVTDSPESIEGVTLWLRIA